MSVGPTGGLGSEPPRPESAPEPKGDLRRVFLGPDGIRAGWSILLFIALTFAIGFVIVVALRYVARRVGHFPAPQSAVGAIINDLVTILPILGATAIMARIEGRTTLDYGLRDGQWLRRFATGAAWGFVLISFLIGLLRVTGHLAFDGQLIHGQMILTDALLLGVVFLLVGVTEEVTFRGYLQYTAARGIGFWPAAILLSFGFGGAHLFNPGEHLFGAFAAGFAGFVFCYPLYRLGSLWWSIGAHFAWDWGQSYFYGVPDSGLMFPGHLQATHPVGPDWLSGGTVGPEGSIFVILAFGLVIPIVALTTRGRSTWPPPAPARLADISH
jgi:membrane protease YdiL (CAAX protease family)